MTAPDRTAVLFVECQRGVVGDLSVLPALAEEAKPALAAMGRLAAGARDAGVVVAHLIFEPAAGGRATNQRSRLMRATAGTSDWDDARPGGEVVPEIGVGPEDLVLVRHQGISPVHRTETLAMLRNMGIDEVVLAGVSTNIAIPVVAVAANDEDFSVTIPPDAVVGTPAEHHQSMLRHVLGLLGDLTPVDEVLARWRS